MTVRKRDDHPRGVRGKSRTERVVDLHEPRTLEAVSRYMMHERPLAATSPFVFLVGGNGKRRLEPLSYDAVVRMFARRMDKLSDPTTGDDAARTAPHPRHGNVGGRDARADAAEAARPRLSGVHEDLHPSVRRRGARRLRPGADREAMTALALITRESTRRALSRCHAPRKEYFDWVRDVFAGTPSSIKSRRYFYNRFVRHWPDLEDWFAAPLLVRLDLHDRDQWQTGKRKGPSHEAGTYLTYLSLVHGLPMDADWLLSRNFDSMFHPRVAAGLGLDLALLDSLGRAHDTAGLQAHARSTVTWSLARLTLRRGDPDFTTITAEDIRAFGEELTRYCARPEAGFIRATHVSNARRHDDMDKLATQFGKNCTSRLYTFHVLLFNSRAGRRETDLRAATAERSGKTSSSRRAPRRRSARRSSDG